MSLQLLWSAWAPNWCFERFNLLYEIIYLLYIICKAGVEYIEATVWTVDEDLTILRIIVDFKAMETEH